LVTWQPAHLATWQPGSPGDLATTCQERH